MSSSNIIFDDSGQVESFAQFEMPVRKSRFDAAESRKESEVNFEGLQSKEESEEKMFDTEDFQSFRNCDSEESAESEIEEEEPVLSR